MTRPTRAWRMAVVLATASLALTACGNNNDKSAEGGSGASGAASKSANAPAKGDGTLTIGTLLPQTGDLAFLGPPEFAGVADRDQRHQRGRRGQRQGRRPGQGRLR